MWTTPIPRVLATLAAILALNLGLTTQAAAEQSVDVGDYVIHYTAFTTDILQPEMAQRYDITRSPNQVLLNVSVLKKVMGTTGRPVSAEVEAIATNLSNQLEQIQMREVDDAGAIYHLGSIAVTHGETLRFAIKVEPQGTDQAYTVRFRKQFFTKD